MKEKILKKIRNNIKIYKPTLNGSKLDEIMYGIESIYLVITKTIIIFTIAFILNIYKELFLLLFFFNIIRIFGFGMHANNSKSCLIFSSLLFISFTFLTKYLIINKFILTLFYIVYFFLLIKYSPADTVKRPLLNKRKRKNFKLFSIIILIIYFIVTLISKNKLINNSIFLGTSIEIILILPITYKIFKMPYGNYKRFKRKSD